MKKIVLVVCMFGFKTILFFAQSPFYNTGNIQKIELFFANPNWDYQLDTARTGKDKHVMAQWAKINGQYFDSVGVKYKGSSSYDSTYLKNPLHIELNTYKEQYYQGIADIKLNNCYADPSMIREVLAYEIARNYMQAPQSNFAQVYINGIYRGVYTNAEAINNNFLNNHFNSKGGTFVKCNPKINPSPAVKSNLKFMAGSDSSSYYNYYEMKSDYGWAAMQALCDTITNKPSAVESILDIDEAIWMLAFNTVLVNLDSYNGAFAQNYYLYKDKNQIFHTLIWDLNMSFGGFPFLGNSNSSLGSLSISSMQNLPLNIHANDAYWPLINLVNNNARYNKMLVTHLKTITNEAFVSGWYLNKCNAYSALIDTAVLSDSKKFYTYSQFQNALNANTSVGSYSVPGIQTLMSTRLSYLLGSGEFAAGSPTIVSTGEVSVPVNLNSVITITANIINANNTGVFLKYRYSKTEPFKELQMYDDGAHADGSANDGMFGLSLVFSANQLQYYVYAENSLASVFSPARAAHEFYTVSIHRNPLPGEITINEFLADNSSDVRNEYHLNEDWIELYNNSKNTLNLEGYYLSDDKQNKPLFAFPKGTSMAPETFMTVWADNIFKTNTQLHCNFKLNNTLGSIVLSDGSYTTLDEYSYIQQLKDESMGRCPDGYGAFKTFKYPTFGLYNCTTGLDEAGEMENNFKLYPNPASTYLVIVYESNSANTLKISDTFGKVLYAEQFSGKAHIAIDTYKPGVYIVSCGTISKKLIINP